MRRRWPGGGVWVRGDCAGMWGCCAWTVAAVETARKAVDPASGPSNLLMKRTIDDAML